MKNIVFLHALLVVILTSGCSTKTSEIYTTDAGAIGGYDPVAFFTDSAAVPGSKDFSYEWHDATWMFSSAANLEAFKAAPEKYAPQYGGWCAYGTADGDGHLSPTQPDTWTVVDNKLYFNYNLQVKERWMEDQPGYILKADKNWPGLKK